MIFIFRGYHHQKFVQREKEAKEKEEAEMNFKQTSEHSE
jgi:hypothetical protein